MRRLILPLLVAGALVQTACNDDTTGDSTGTVDSTETDDSSTTGVTDADGDGYATEDGDCDDENGDVFPGQIEDCNGLDDNCNDLTDEGLPDADGDGTADCMDVEDCDGVDNDGDGEVDEGFPDVDEDGHADCVSEEICDGIDNNGDGDVDEGFDEDEDGHAECTTDCDDTDGDVHPDAEEVAGDLVDNDCDGLVDEVEWAAGDLVITELMINPLVTSDSKGEWFEIHNTTNRTLYLNGLVLSSSIDGDSYALASDDMIVMESGETLVLGKHDDETTNGGVTIDVLYASDVILNNEVDELVISAGEVIIDQVAWDDGDTMPDPEGASIQLDPFFLTAELNDNADYWCDSITTWGTGTDMGSPGEENPLCHDTDHDGDGFTTSDGDCDDLDPDAYPDAPEKDGSKDNDCDGDVEHMPEADATYDTGSSLHHCDPLQLLGSGSSDPNGDTLSYDWELTSAPAASALTTSDIQSTTDADPVFYPDVAGTYVFTLTVTDVGGAYSYPDSLTLDIATRPDNTDPVSDPGSQQTYSEEVSCQAWSYGVYYTCDDCEDYDFTLDGSGSSDPDGHELIYAWAVTAGDGSLTDETTSSPTLTFGGPSAEYGETNSDTVTVELTVTDCMGATNTESLTLEYQCTGT